jgi:RNA polymerase sigma factor (sigma-70 family)
MQLSITPGPSRMADPSPQTVLLEGWLGRLRAGDRSVLDELIRHAGDRLQRLTRQMLHGYPGVKRWAQTDDVLQSALVRLLRALQAVQPASAREFFGLATEQVRRELLDLARHFYGPEGQGANHATRHPGAGQGEPEKPDLSHEPSSLAEWCELHEQIGALPEVQRDVVGLIFYQGLTQAEAAEVLNVAVRTVQRRWQAALLRLHRFLKHEGPGS